MIEGVFLGTGTSQGVPVIGCQCPVCISTDIKDNRLRTSFCITIDGASFVIDPGPDFRQQMLRETIGKVDGVLITHEHNDHVAGMDDLRPYYFMQKQDIPLYASSRVLQELQTRFAYAFDQNPYPGTPRFRLQPIHSNRTFPLNGLEVIPIEVEHGGVSVLGFRFRDFTYITDAKLIAGAERDKIKGSKVLVLNALRKTPHYSHLHLEAAMDLAADCKVGQTWFTHISHEMGLFKDVDAGLPSGFNLAYDGLRLSL